MADNEFDKKKQHNKKHAGRKAAKKAAKSPHVQSLTPEQRNPKAFAVRSAVKAKKQYIRSQDLLSKKHHIPVVDRTPVEPPPLVVAIIGGPKVGKSTLLQCLVKNFTHHKLSSILGPVTVVAAKKIRLTFIEVNNDINCMIDIAKVADVALLLIDATFGIEMEVFEFLEISRAHGTPKILGVLNHLDMLKDNKALKKKKKILKHRFQVELYPGILHGEYLKRDINNLARFICVMKLRPLNWRLNHPYMLVDRYEDITNPEEIRVNSNCDRNVVLYGYVRGVPLQKNSKIHVLGCGDFQASDITVLSDPCPLPEQLKKRSLNAKEKLLYAPFSGVGGIVYDKDAVYIDLGGSHHGREAKHDDDDVEIKENSLDPIMDLQKTTDEKRSHSQVKLFANSQPLVAERIRDQGYQNDNLEVPSKFPCSFEDVDDGSGRVKRRVVFNDEENELEYLSSEEEQVDDDFLVSECTTNSFKRQKIDSLSSDSDTDYFDKDDEISTGKTLNKVGENIEKPKNSNLEVTDKIKMLLNKINMLDKKEGNTLSNELKDDHMVEEAVKSEVDKTFQIEMFRQAKDNFLKNQSSLSYLRNFIYGVHEEVQTEGDDTEEVGGLFMKRKSKMSVKKDLCSVEDTVRYNVPILRNWNDLELLHCIKDCFVTGKWSVESDAQKLLEMDAEDLYGDFEDFETGEKSSGNYIKSLETGEKSSKSDTENANELQNEKVEKTATEKRLEKKRKLKEFFDSQYDGGQGDYFENLKAEMSQQSQLNRSEFELLDEETRILYEGYRPGLYIRMEVLNLPCEFVKHFDPGYPIIVGGILDNEQNIGYVKVRIKVHRWFPKILKSRDPLILSLGWRRFQTVMFYAKREDNFRMRSLKYARKYLHIEAVFWGPVTPVGSGFVAFQNISERMPNFRIAANGVVLELDHSTKITKKLKLLGYPEKTHKKTAFIKDMFTSDLEISKFIGAKIQTQSGIRGIIKKSQGQDGMFRATFEDTIKKSDVVILKTWATVAVTQFYSILRTLLLPASEKAEWQGMKTVADIKKDKGIENNPALDSLYTPITDRRTYKHLSWTIPKRIQRDLPYSDKPKVTPQGKLLQRIVVVKNKEELKIDEFMSKLKIMMADKLKKQKLITAAKKKQFKKELMEKEKIRQFYEKKKKKEICALLGRKKGSRPVK